MSILFGHPGGNPNSHHAALAHFEAGWLEAFCVPWMPTPRQLQRLYKTPGLRGLTARLERRCFLPLLNAPRIEGRSGEWWRMIRRAATPKWADERLSYEANDWLMRTMARECRRPCVTAVHAYEDCSLWQFEEAKRLGKACIYDMPIGYYEAWDEKQRLLAKEFSEWIPPQGLPSNRYVRPEQKRREMELADLVLAPSTFVVETIRSFYNDKPVALAPYGVDLEFWQQRQTPRGDGPLRFLYAGQISIRKGIPVLLEAWRKARIRDAQLELVGLWQLSLERRAKLPPDVVVHRSRSREQLRDRYQSADVFVFPSFFEGFALAPLEAMACGLPLIATKVMAGMDLVAEATGQSVIAGDVEALIESLRWFGANRDRLSTMKRAARAAVEAFTWECYRRRVRAAVVPFGGDN